MTPGETSRQLAVGDYLTILNRRKWVIIQSTLIVAIVAYVLSARQDEVFRARADVLLTRQNISNVVTGVTSPDVYTDPVRFAETQAGLARAPEVAKLAIAKSKVNLTSGELLANSNVQPQSNADLLQFTVDNGDRAIATKLANAYAESFTAFKANLDTEQLSQAREELQGRLAELRSAGQTRTVLYNELLQSAQQLRTMEILQTRNLVVHPATDASLVAPTPTRNGLLGAFLGLLLGLGIAALWEALDKRVRTDDEIERRLSLPLLSRLPEPPKKLQSQGRLTMIDDPSAAHAEAIRRLRTNLEFVNIDRNARTIMVTSALEMEGKSTTVANLAVALARSGRSVALVDLDLRKPMIKTYFSLDGRAGITDVVLGRVNLEDALAAIRVPVPISAPLPGGGPRNAVGAMGRLDVLVTGPLPANPGEFVGTQTLARALEDLRTSHDFVLIDAPPVLAVGDAMTLSSRVDGILVVARLGSVDRRTLTDLSRELEASPAAKLGFVVTGVDPRGGYSYSYGYGKAPGGGRGKRSVAAAPDPERQPVVVRSARR